MQFRRCDFDANDWNSSLCRSGYPNLLQSWEYGTAKALTSPWAVERGHILDGNVRIGAAQALIRTLPFGRGGVAWINRAPVWETAQPDGETIRESIDALVNYYGRERGLYLRLAVPIECRPEVEPIDTPNFQRTSIKGWASARIDLMRSEDDLLHGLRGNWRNSLRKAEKSGIYIEIGDNDFLFERFLGLHQKFVIDRKFATSLTPHFLQTLQEILPESNKMIVFSARQGANVLGTVLIARFGAACEYWAGNASGRYSGVGVGHLLLWRALLEMKRRGYTSFDVGGLDPDLTPKGIYAFKAGVSATPYRLINEIEATNLNMLQKMVRAYVAQRR